jgi:membrane protease YdiL (CAAX protease family)
MKHSAQFAIRAPILAIMIFQVAALFVRAFLEVHLIETGEPEPYAQDLSYLVVPPLLAILMYPVLRQHKAFLLSLMRRRDVTIRLVAISILLGLTLRLSFWGGLISFTSFGILRSSDPTSIVGPVVSFGCPEPGILALSFLVTSFLIPVTEEAVNRGLILPSLLKRGRIVAVIVSSVLFAVMHDPQAILIAFLIGLCLGMQMLNTNSLWAPTITHATYNGMAVLDWECVSGQWNPVERTPELSGLGLIGSALLFVSVSFSIFLVSRIRGA